MNNNVILNYGIKRDGNFLAIPFFIIDGVMTNYSFIGNVGDSVEYLTEVGELKEQGLKCLGADLQIIDIEIGTKQNMKLEIAMHHDKIAKSTKEKFKKAVLYRIHKTKDDDTVFYDALNISPKKYTPQCFSKMGIKPSSPFLYVSIEEMFYQNKPEIVCTF